MHLHLLPDWHQAWRWSSVRFLALGAATQGALLTAPARVTDYVPGWLMSGLASFSLVCIMLAGLGRITTTEKPDEPAKLDH